MRCRVINPEVQYADEPIVRVGKDDIERLKAEMRKNGRDRIRLCVHKGVEDELHEMLIIHAKGAYVRPHKHPGKSESLHIIEGEADILIFDDEGGLKEHISMGEYASGKRFFYRIADPIYHGLIIKSDIIVFHEATKGPFDRSDTVFAPWAPDAADEAACREFMKRMESGGG